LQEQNGRFSLAVQRDHREANLMSDSIYRDEKLLRFLHRAANFARTDFYLEEHPFRKELGSLCRINYIGPRFQRGGVALVGHSSGSGEKRGEECFAERDRWLSATGAGTVIWLGKGAYRKAEHHWREVPVDAVVNRERGLPRGKAFEDLDEKIGSGIIRT
jgi:hypothetical protein